MEHCVWERELPAGSHARLACSPVWGGQAGGLLAQPSPHPEPNCFQGESEPFLHVPLFKWLETLEENPNFLPFSLLFP